VGRSAAIGEQSADCVKPGSGWFRCFGKLRISIIPAHSNIRVGQVLTVSAEVYNSLGQQLGTGECELKWSDALSGWKATTACAAKVSEPPVSTAGVHRIVAEAEGRSGVLATGKQSVEVTVRR
jgi:hypothetical protein